jgi:hypothetical protein
MNNNSIGLFIFIVTMLTAQVVWAAERTVKIVKPVNNAQLSSPVKICMEVSGATVEKAKKGVTEAKGHHHLLFNSLPVI